MEEALYFATVGDARVAYQVHGGGGADIVYSPGLASHLDMAMELPRYRRFVESLCRYGRVIRFDRRGTGISDPAPPSPDESWDLWTEDLHAVLDAAGSREAAVVATNDAGAAAMLFAATHPERVRALVLFNTSARFTAAADYPQGHPPEAATDVVETLRSTWGTDASTPLLTPSLMADESYLRWATRFQRAAISPGAMADLIARVLRIDARHVLTEIRCPTLVIHRSGYAVVPAGQARYLADRIPQSTYVELPGADGPIYTEGTERIVELIGRLLGVEPRAAGDEGRFATVLFSDIVSSTRRAAELGDHAWHRVLDDHDAATRGAVLAHGGRFIKSTGDGALASFDAAGRAIAAANAICAAVAALGLQVRMGLHAGPVVTRHDGDIGGLAVHSAARVMSKAGPGEVWASSTVAALVTDPDVRFADRGRHALSGVPGTWQLFEVE